MVSRLRCAIYTRKSSEEGLEQNFNSLDAQREACEAYIMSQIGEGWAALPTKYDDGGFSGGSMERPGLKKLLADIERGQIDVVVVYKVDRLTRSLADFARIVDAFDRKGVSFVSVTQAFNTTSSMGRLTLNVLLSFAQFEREVTGERIRDKIAASKKKGMWMGGTPPLGYSPHERTLVINVTEAATVRHIFNRYLALKSVHALQAELDRDGIVSRRNVSRTGRISGGTKFGRGALYHLLSNQLYLGRIVHKDEVYPGQHPPIIDEATFDAVAELLAANRQERRDQPVTKGRSPLTGSIFDADGQPMSPVSARKKGAEIYRYYVSASLQQGGAREGKAGLRLSAPLVEELVLEKVQRIAGGVGGWATARSLLKRVTVEPRCVRIDLKLAGKPRFDALDPDDEVIEHDEGLEVLVPVQFRAWGGRTEITRGGNRQLTGRPKMDAALVRGLARAHQLARVLETSTDQTSREIGAEQGASPSYIRRLSRLAFLAPDLQQRIVEGRQPAGLSLERLMRIDLPMSWKSQRELFR